MKLTQEEKRIKIAEVCGWTGIRGNIGYPNAATEAAEVYYLIPNYFNDLNACHKVWQSFTKVQHEQFKWHLVQIVREVKDFDGPKASVTCAPASLRAEAIGRTFEAWKAGE